MKHVPGALRNCFLFQKGGPGGELCGGGIFFKMLFKRKMEIINKDKVKAYQNHQNKTETIEFGQTVPGIGSGTAKAS